MGHAVFAGSVNITRKPTVFSGTDLFGLKLVVGLEAVVPGINRRSRAIEGAHSRAGGPDP